MSIISPRDAANLIVIAQTLDKAYDHYFANSDGHCKSAEGNISIDFNNYFERRRDGERVLKIKSVNIYSYVFGPYRESSFDTTIDALIAVSDWYKEEMEHDYSDERY